FLMGVSAIMSLNTAGSCATNSISAYLPSSLAWWAYARIPLREVGLACDDNGAYMGANHWNHGHEPLIQVVRTHPRTCRCLSDSNLHRKDKKDCRVLPKDFGSLRLLVSELPNKIVNQGYCHARFPPAKADRPPSPASP